MPTGTAAACMIRPTTTPSQSGSPRRSRTAKASRISRHAVKSRCAHEWDGWGGLSDDGPGHHNPDPSEDPWGGGVITLQGGAQTAHAGSRLKPADDSGRHRLESQPSSRTGENPPYGMIGRIEETSASFEAGSAPRSYPTPITGHASSPADEHPEESIAAGLFGAKCAGRQP